MHLSSTYIEIPRLISGIVKVTDEHLQQSFISQNYFWILKTFFSFNNSIQITLKKNHKLFLNKKKQCLRKRKFCKTLMFQSKNEPHGLTKSYRINFSPANENYTQFSSNNFLSIFLFIFFLLFFRCSMCFFLFVTNAMQILLAVYFSIALTFLLFYSLLLFSLVCCFSSNNFFFFASVF